MLPKKIVLKLPLLFGALLLLRNDASAFKQQEYFSSRIARGSPEKILVYLDSGKDQDRDGLSDQAEKEYGTNPKSPDTDKDGMVDSDEVLIYHTNPLHPDSDNDTLSDPDEIMKFLTDPLHDDTDRDHLKDGAEYAIHQTNPLKADTDNDGVTDGEEVNRYKTHPLIADSDSDGIADGIEIYRFVSDPNHNDTDGDGIPDGRDKCPNEAATGESYGIAEGCPNLKPQIWVEVNQVIVLVGVNFLAGEANPTPPSVEALEKVYNTLAENPEVSFEVQGFADGAGDEEANLRLSQSRAEAVREYFVKRGIMPERLRAVGYGESNPIAANDSAEGRAQNRRIELHRLQ